MIVCVVCKETKSLDNFRGKYDAGMYKTYISNQCNSCVNKKKSEYLHANREVWKNERLKVTHGITLHEYTKLLDSQQGVCAICNKSETATKNGRVVDLCVDHDHEHGYVRGLLCSSCNMGLGKFKDDKNLLEAAKQYLMEWEY